MWNEVCHAFVLPFQGQALAGVLDGPGYRDLLLAQGLKGPNQRKAFDQLVERYPRCELVWLGRAQVRTIALSGRRLGDVWARAAAIDDRS